METKKLMKKEKKKPCLNKYLKSEENILHNLVLFRKRKHPVIAF